MNTFDSYVMEYMIYKLYIPIINKMYKIKSLSTLSYLYKKYE